MLCYIYNKTCIAFPVFWHSRTNLQVHSDLWNLNIVATRPTVTWMLRTFRAWPRPWLGVRSPQWTWPPAYRRPWALPSFTTIKHTYMITVSISHIRATSYTRLHSTAVWHHCNMHEHSNYFALRYTHSFIL